MATTFECSAVNQLFLAESGRFSIDIWDRYTQDSPWGRLTRVGKFPQQMGTSINEITVERVLSGNFEDNWSSVTNSNGETVGVGCLPSPLDLSFGETVRNWGLQTQSYRTPCVCLDDLKTDFAIDNQVGKTVSQLSMLTKTVLDNHRRAAYAGMVSWYSAGNGGIGTTFTGGATATFPAPTAQLSSDFLDDLRILNLRNGAGQDALGHENGGPVLGLVGSSRVFRNMLRQDPELRQDIRYAAPSELVQPLGVERSFGGWYHIEDIEIPRYDYLGGLGGNPWIRRYPFVKVATTNGFAWEPDPLYDTAQFELLYDYHPNVYEEAVQQVGPSIPDAPFDDYPYYYSGQAFWLNIISDLNPLGKIGRWLMVFQNGSRPIAPYLGHCIMVKRCPNDMSLRGCQYYD